MISNIQTFLEEELKRTNEILCQETEKNIVLKERFGKANYEPSRLKK